MSSMQTKARQNLLVATVNSTTAVIDDDGETRGEAND